MKRLLFFSALFLVCFALNARQIWTPLLLQRGSLSELYTELKKECWIINVWDAYYARSAHQAFDCAGKSTPLSTLIFNKPTFNAQEIFASNKAQAITNPLLATSILGPRVRYKESGVMIGFDLQAYVGENCRMGFRANLPVRKIRMRRCKSQGNGSSDLGGQTVHDVTAERIETVNGDKVLSYAYRLDFLSRLPYTCEKGCPGSDIALVNYADPDFPPNNPITISNQDVTDQTGTNVSVLKSDTGTIPQGQLAITQKRAQQLPILNGNGTNVGDRNRARFDHVENYTPLGNSPANQAELFVVPSVANGKTVPPARVIQQHVRELIACIDQQAEDIFKRCGISFDSTCRSGIGDFDTELFVGYFVSQCLYGEAFMGVKWPTGKRSCNPREVFSQPLGNNGHYEYKLGLQGIWEPCTWFNAKADLAWSTVQRNQEIVASSFLQAQVKNIGVPTCADVAWDYFVFHGDILLTPCWTHGLGIDIGYELYHKRKDDLVFVTDQLVDCLGVLSLLDSQGITSNTRVTSHKVRGEAFWIGGYGEIFGGGSHVFAGKNAPKETEWYVGAAVYF